MKTLICRKCKKDVIVFNDKKYIEGVSYDISICEFCVLKLITSLFDLIGYDSYKRLIKQYGKEIK